MVEVESKEKTSLSAIMNRIIQKKERNRLSDAFAETDVPAVINKYLSEPVIVSSPLQYWKEYEHSSKSDIEKGLVSLAKKYLTPPPTSTDVERLFSTAGNILSPERNCLRPHNVEKLLFCRENLPLVNFKY